MSIRNLTTENNINLFCSDFECKTMICDNMIIPQGGDLNAHDVKIENNLLVKTQDGLNYIKYNTPNKGNAGEQLTIDSNGEAYWSNSAGPGGVSNPLSTDLYTNGFKIYDNQGDTANIFIGPSSIGITGILGCADKFLPASGIDSGGDIDIKSGVLKTAEVKSTISNLTLSGSNNGLPANVILSGSTTQISCNNGIDMLNHPITNCSLLYSQNLNNVKLIRSEADFNGSTNLSGSYIIYGNVNMTSGYTLTSDVSIMGIGRDVCSLNFNIGDSDPAGYCILNNDFNFSISNINISNTSNEYSLLRCNNTPKDKILTITNSSFMDCENGELIHIEGFDLVDINNVIFMYNNVALKHFYHNSGSKLQITSCEFLRQGTRASPIVSWGTAPMIELESSNTPFGSINISSNIIHPQQSQSGIFLSSNLSAIDAIIGSNTFINLGLTTGILLNYDGNTINNYNFLTVGDNTGIINEKSIVELALEGNTTYTSTVSGQYVALNTPNITFPILKRFTSLGNTLLRYDGKKPIYININCNLLANQNDSKANLVRFGIEQNGNLVSSLGFTVEDNKNRSFGYTATLILNNLDEIEFVCQNIDAGTSTVGFRAIDVNISIVEI